MSTTPSWPSVAPAADTTRRPWVHKLPSELLASVLAHLDASSRLVPRFRDDPATLLDSYHAAAAARRHPDHPLKTASLVCRRWRATVLPRLFRHVLWTFRRLEEPTVEDKVGCFDLLAFLRRNRLGAAVDGLTMHVPCPEHLIDDPTELVGRYGLLPHAGVVVEEEEEEEEDMDESVVLSETASSVVLAEDNGHATWANTWFWEMLFGVVDPLRVSVVAAPVVLATMLSLKVFTRCQPLLMTRYHLFSVARADRRPAPPPCDDTDTPANPVSAATRHASAPPSDAPLPCELFTPARPWSCLLANEGSSTSIYKTDAYGEIPPSPLLSLLAAAHSPLHASLRRFEYVAVMPMATHLRAVAALVPPRLEALYVQIMPRGDRLDRRGRFDGLDVEDLLMERDSVYDLLFGAIFVPGPRPEWQALRVFETGDAEADDTAWAEAVETVRASANCWEVASRGRFVRNLAKEESRRKRQGTTAEGAGLASSAAL